MKITLFDDFSRLHLQPFTFTRPVFDLRVGIDRIFEKWTRWAGGEIELYAFGYLSTCFSKLSDPADRVWVNGKFIPEENFFQILSDGVPEGVYLVNAQDEILAFSAKSEQIAPGNQMISAELLENMGLKPRSVGEVSLTAIRRPADIFQLNRKCLELDFPHFTRQYGVAVQDKHTAVYGADNLFVHPSAKIRAAVLNAEDGPIYIGPNTDIQEGAIIHSAHAICDGATVNMGAKLRGDSTIGPVCKVGGEVANSVLQGYSNKGHDGYLGNSVMGYWCNLGADSNTSNLKNNYTEVRLWDYETGRFAPTGTIFCGLMMGDHSKCGINTMFNTGTVVGVSANIFGAGYPRNFVPSFSWGGSGGLSTYRFSKAMEVARAVMGRRKMELSAEEEAVLNHVFETSSRYRSWEKK